MPALAAPSESASRRPDLRLVRPRRRFRTGLLGTIVISLVFTTLFVLAAMQAVLVQGQLKLDRLQSDLGQRSQAKDRLELQVNTLESPDRLAQAASALGMVPAPQVMFLYADPAAGTDRPPTTGPVATPDTLAASPPTTASAPATAPSGTTPAADRSQQAEVEPTAAASVSSDAGRAGATSAAGLTGGATGAAGSTATPTADQAGHG